MTRPYLAMIDYGTGNVHSLGKALERVGCTVRLTRDPAELAAAAGLVLPGVGAFGTAWRRLEAAGLAGLILRLVAEGRPLLGVCLGMQLLFEGSEEDGDWPGLGLLPGRSTRFGGGLKVPHMGWNRVAVPAGMRLLAGLEDGFYAYFVHSYRVPWPAGEPGAGAPPERVPAAGAMATGPAGAAGAPGAATPPGPAGPTAAAGLEPGETPAGSPAGVGPAAGATRAGTGSHAPRLRLPGAAPLRVALATYGGPFVAAVECGPVFGTQFHPEKSGPVGLHILRNFGAICGACDPGA